MAPIEVLRVEQEDVPPRGRVPLSAQWVRLRFVLSAVPPKKWVVLFGAAPSGRKGSLDYVS